MNILDVPFHKILDIKEYPGDEYIFEAGEKPEFLNHLQTIHACAQLALAEASSGEYLLQQFRELESQVIPVIRKTEVKYHRPANGRLFSRAFFPSSTKAEMLEEFLKRSRIIIPIQVELYNEDRKKVLTAVFDWFLTKR